MQPRVRLAGSRLASQGDDEVVHQACLCGRECGRPAACQGHAHCVAMIAVTPWACSMSVPPQPGLLLFRCVLLRVPPWCLFSGLMLWGLWSSPVLAEEIPPLPSPARFPPGRVVCVAPCCRRSSAPGRLQACRLGSVHPGPVAGPVCVLDISAYSAWSVWLYFETLLSGSRLRV